MDLKINFEETISVGNQITAKSEEFKGLLSRIKNVNLNLKRIFSFVTFFINFIQKQKQYL